jgi:hypothetical protein
MSVRQLLALAAHLAIGAVSALAIAAGGATLVALPFVFRPPESEFGEWIATIRQTALAIGPAFLIGGLGARILMPARRELLRLGDGNEPAPPAGVTVLLAGLAAVAVAQVPMLLAWWDETRAVIDQLLAGERDPMGFWIIPTVLLNTPPFLAALILTTFVLTSVIAAAAGGMQASRALVGCVVLQSGFVIGAALALTQARNLAARLLSLVSSAPDAGLLASMTAVVERQDSFASAMLTRVEWLLAGYAILAAVLWYRQGSDAVVRTPSSDGSLATPATPATSIPRATSALSSIAVVAEASPNLPEFLIGDDYRVRLRTPWILAAFRIGHLDYDIVPTGSRGDRLAFLGETGELRRELGGTALLRLERERRAVPLLRPSYLAKDPSTGQIVAAFEPDGNDWIVLDRSRQRIARIEEFEARPGYWRYRLLVDGSEICKFTWGMHGLGVWTAEMDVEFARGSDARFDRRLALAFAPILEAHARRSSQRSA